MNAEDGQTVIEVSSEAGTAHMPARGPVVRVGRSTANDVVLSSEPTVSREHAELHLLTGTGWTVRDLGSANGTHVNGVRLVGDEVHPVGPDDVVGVGNVTLRLLQAVEEGRTVEDASGREMHRLLTALSERERQVLTLVAAGLTDDQVAKELFISTKTVHSHLERIRDKTGLRRRAELTRLAVRLGLSRTSR